MTPLVVDLLERAVFRVCALYAALPARDREQIKRLCRRLNSTIAARERHLLLHGEKP
jgi:hypothetical protein